MVQNRKVILVRTVIAIANLHCRSDCKRCFFWIIEKSKPIRHLLFCLTKDHFVCVKMTEILSRRMLPSVTIVLLNYSPSFRRAEKHVLIIYFILKNLLIGMNWTHVQVLSWTGKLAEIGVLKDNIVVSFFPFYYSTNFV